MLILRMQKPRTKPIIKITRRRREPTTKRTKIRTGRRRKPRTKPIMKRTRRRRGPTEKRTRRGFKLGEKKTRRSRPQKIELES